MNASIAGSLDYTQDTGHARAMVTDSMEVCKIYWTESQQQ